MRHHSVPLALCAGLGLALLVLLAPAPALVTVSAAPPPCKGFNPRCTPTPDPAGPPRGPKPTAPVTDTATPAPTVAATASPSPTRTPAPTATATATNAPTASPVATASATSATPSPASTATPTRTPAPATATATTAPTSTPAPATDAPTATPSPTASATAIPTPTPTDTPAPTITATLPDPPPAVATPASFAPVEIPLGTELPNPWTGQYWWLYQGPVGGMTPVDAYDRFPWVYFEPTKGQYNWAQFDRLIQQAKLNGGHPYFQMLPSCPGCGLASSVPAYVQACGGWAAADGSFVPDWDSECYLSSLETVLQAIGDHYRARGQWLGSDLIGYGAWGEWHDCGTERPGEPSCANTSITEPDAERIVRANYTLLNGGDGSRMTIQPALQPAAAYALALSPSIGLRCNALGQDPGLAGCVDALNGIATLYPAVWDRWKAARFVTEWGTGSGQFPATQYADPSIAQLHITNSSSGNQTFPAPTSQWVDAFNRMGGRPRIERATVTIGGGVGRFSLDWQNDGNAPPYGHWSVLHQLRDATGAIVWQGVSGVAFASAGTVGLLPTNGVAVHRDDTISISLPPGTYTYSVQIRDNDGLSAPWNLAQEGRGPDGAYVLGPVTVGP